MKAPKLVTQMMYHVSCIMYYNNHECRLALVMLNLVHTSCTHQYRTYTQVHTHKYIPTHITTDFRLIHSALLMSNFNYNHVYAEFSCV